MKLKDTRTNRELKMLKQNVKERASVFFIGLTMTLTQPLGKQRKSTTL